MKTASVTGGGSGVGLAIARSLAAETFRAGLIGRRAELLAAAAHAINESGGDCGWDAVDVRDSTAVQAFVDQAVGQSGNIDLLVTAREYSKCAGSKTHRSIWGMSSSDQSHRRV